MKEQYKHTRNVLEAEVHERVGLEEEKGCKGVSRIMNSKHNGSGSRTVLEVGTRTV